MTDVERQAAELLLIPEMLRRDLNGSSLPAHPDTRRAAGELQAAKQIATLGLTLTAKARAHGVADVIVGEAETAAKFADRFGLVAYHFAKILTDADAIAIGPQSALGRALAVITLAFEDTAQVERLDEAASKQDLRVLRASQRRGISASAPPQLHKLVAREGFIHAAIGDDAPPIAHP